MEFLEKKIILLVFKIGRFRSVDGYVTLTIPINTLRLFILPLVFMLVHSYGQDKLQPPIHNLPIAGLEDSGFNKDSVENLLRSIETSPPYDFRGGVVIKNNKIVIEEYFNTF